MIFVTFLWKTPLWIIRVFRGPPSESSPPSFMCSISTYFLWKAVITNLCFHEMANARATMCSCTGCALHNSRTLTLDCTINDAPCVMQLVHCSWDSPWHVYDLYRLKMDQKSGSPWLDFHCIFGTSGCVFLINAFLGHILHNYGTKNPIFLRRWERYICWNLFVGEFVDPWQLLDHKSKFWKENSLFCCFDP